MLNKYILFISEQRHPRTSSECDTKETAVKRDRKRHNIYGFYGDGGENSRVYSWRRDAPWMGIELNSFRALQRDRLSSILDSRVVDSARLAFF